MNKLQSDNPRFEQFWQIYPRHEVKVRARKAFEKIDPDDDTLREMLQWIEAAKYSTQWQTPQYIPHPATWLNRRQWEDDVPPMRPRDTVGQNDDEECLLTESQKDELRRKYAGGL